MKVISTVRPALAPVLLAVTLLGAAPAARAAAPPASVDFAQIGQTTFDVLVLRPVGFVALAVSSVAFLPAALISAPMAPDSTRDAWERFVMERFEDVFRRPLGEL